MGAGYVQPDTCRGSGGHLRSPGGRRARGAWCRGPQPMITIQLFGAVNVRDRQGRELRELLRQPKRLALLAYLAAEGPERTQRDVLRALFWPESDAEHARHALNQHVPV